MPSKSRHDPLEEAYREETARLVRARFPYAVGYYLVASAALLFLVEEPPDPLPRAFPRRLKKPVKTAALSSLDIC